jgi:hypothetical protein
MCSINLDRAHVIIYIRVGGAKLCGSIQAHVHAAMNGIGPVHRLVGWIINGEVSFGVTRHGHHFDFPPGRKSQTLSPPER